MRLIDADELCKHLHELKTGDKDTVYEYYDDGIDMAISEAAALFKSLGMDLSTATGIFYRQALRCHGLPFEVKVDEPNAVTYAAMEAAEKGEDMYGPFDSVADLMEAIKWSADGQTQIFFSRI